MNSTVRQRGASLRVMIGTLAAVLFVPMMVLLGAFFAYETSLAQQEPAGSSTQLPSRPAAPPESATPAVASEPVGLTNTEALPGLKSVPGDPNVRYGYRTVVETEYREQRQQVPATTVNPKTGETVHSTREIITRVPVTTTRLVRIPQSHSPKVMQLATELRKMDADDEDREKILKELESLLVNEFDERHQKQSEEIKRTEKRLQELKETHRKRAELKEEIVQRRIDQLMGEPDIMQWDPRQPGTLPLTAGTLRGAVPGVPTYPGQRSALNPINTLPGPGVTTTPGSPTGLTRNPNATGGGSFLSPSGTAILPSKPGVPSPVVPGSSAVRSNSFPRSSFFNPANQPTGQAGRIEVTASGGTDVFEIARRISTATMQVALAEEEFQQFSKLKEKALVPESELRVKETKLRMAQRDLAFAEAQLKSLDDRLRRDIEYAENRLARSTQQFESIRESVRSGTASQRVLLDAEGKIDQAKQDLEDARGTFEQMQMAKKLIGDFRRMDAKSDEPASKSAGKETPDSDNDLTRKASETADN